MSKTILIVEDNELNMKLFNDLLEAHGYATLQTRSGVEAVELTRKHMPDLILMDIQLPEVSGLQVTQWIKDDEALRHIPVIAEALHDYRGAMILVSHVPEFVAKIRVDETLDLSK